MQSKAVYSRYEFECAFKSELRWYHVVITSLDKDVFLWKERIKENEII